jgi:hypothetical protein
MKTRGVSIKNNLSIGLQFMTIIHTYIHTKKGFYCKIAV